MDQLDRTARLTETTDDVFGGAGETAAGGGRGFFVAPVLRRCDDPANTPALHDREVFGPVEWSPTCPT